MSRDEIIRVLKEHPGADQKKVARKAGVSAPEARKLLSTLCFSGQVRCEGDRYFAM